ncbi:MAG: hypothetical protein MJ177_09965 [Clostridia bacterium]|nr:hypothetical protein [Clostridia bacterium]
MSTFFKACGTAVICLVCSVMLKKYRPEYAALTQAAGAICILLLILPLFASAAQVLNGFTQHLGQGEEYFALFAKACAAACISSLIACECRDTGNGMLAEISMLMGKICVIIIGLPMIKTVLSAIISMLD